jgi:hypothetical protein
VLLLFKECATGPADRPDQGGRAGTCPHLKAPLHSLGTLRKNLPFTRGPGWPSRPGVPPSLQDLLFGELSGHPLSSIESLLSHCYKPIFEAAEPQVWGRADEEHKADFMGEMDHFIHNLTEVRARAGVWVGD